MSWRKGSKIILRYLDMKASCIENSAREASTFEEFKAVFRAELDEKRTVDFIVREARGLIERREEEFSNEEGMAGDPGKAHIGS